MASLRDIAEASGVSIRTVSRVLRDTGYASPATRERVLKAAEQLGYRPNLTARALRTGCSMEIGLLVGDLSELHMVKMMALEETLRAAGYGLFVLFGHRSGETDGASGTVMERLLQRHPAGVAFMPGVSVDMAAAVAALEGQDIPYIQIDPRSDDWDAVIIAREEGVETSIRYLADRGYTRIAYFGGADPTRLVGYGGAIEALGYAPIVFTCDRVTGELVDQFLALDPRPDAVQVCCDEKALRLLGMLHDRGVRIPDDMAVMGFDDRELAATSWPALSTLAQPNREVGQAAAEILLAKIQGAPVPAGGWTRQLPMRLVKRAST